MGCENTVTSGTYSLVPRWAKGTPAINTSCPRSQRPRPLKPSVKASFIIIFPPPLPSVKLRGPSHPRPLLSAHLLCWTASRREADLGPVGQGTWLWKGWMDVDGMPQSSVRASMEILSYSVYNLPIACPTSPPQPSIPPQAHCVLPLLM